jgi:hypothetical protein
MEQISRGELKRFVHWIHRVLGEESDMVATKKSLASGMKRNRNKKWSP